MFINKEANTCLLSCIDQTLIENVGNVAFSKTDSNYNNLFSKLFSFHSTNNIWLIFQDDLGNLSWFQISGRCLVSSLKKLCFVRVLLVEGPVASPVINNHLGKMTLAVSILVSSAVVVSPSITNIFSLIDWLH